MTRETRCAHPKCGQPVKCQSVETADTHVEQGCWVVDTIAVTNLPCGHTIITDKASDAILTADMSDTRATDTPDTPAEPSK